MSVCPPPRRSHVVRGLLCCLGLAVFLAAPRSVWARGEEQFGNEPVGEANYTSWPGILPLINDESRTYRVWVNGNESFLYEGDRDVLRRLVQAFAATKLEGLRVVVLPGRGERKSFEGKTIPYDAELHLVGGIAAGMARHETPQGDESVWDLQPVLTVFLGREDQLEDSLAALGVPGDVPVVRREDLRKRYAAALSSQKASQRGYAAMFLAEFDANNPASAALVAPLLDDADSWVQSMAILQLGQFGGAAEAALPRLQELAAGGGDEATRGAIAETIAKIQAGVEQRKREEAIQRQ